MATFHRAAARLLTAAALALSLAAPARADTLPHADVLTNMQDGQPIGCEFLFEIDRDAGGGAAAQSLHGDVGVLTSNGRWAAILKVRLDEADRPAAAPSILLMSWNGGDNNAEFGASIETDDPTYALTAFKPGPVTQGALAAFARDGVITLLVTTADGRPSTWTLDATGRPELLQAWRKCLRGFPDLPDAISGARVTRTP